MKPVNIWKICKTQQTNIFQMIDACYKFMFGQKKKKKAIQNERPANFNTTEIKMFTDLISDFTSQLTFKELSLVQFWHGIKKEYS